MPIGFRSTNILINFVPIRQPETNNFTFAVYKNLLTMKRYIIFHL